MTTHPTTQEHRHPADRPMHYGEALAQAQRWAYLAGEALEALDGVDHLERVGFDAKKLRTWGETGVRLDHYACTAAAVSSAWAQVAKLRQEDWRWAAAQVQLSEASQRLEHTLAQLQEAPAPPPAPPVPTAEAPTTEAPEAPSMAFTTEAPTVAFPAEPERAEP